MRLYEFKKTAADPKNNIDVIVVTDGIADQKRIFVTETPRGLSAPGDVTPNPNPNNTILEYGFDFTAGVMYEHLSFVLFAIANGFQLLQWNEGLGESAPIELVPENLTFSYAVTVDPDSLSFEAAGGVGSFTVNSTKTVTTEGPLKGGIYPCKFKVEAIGIGFILDTRSNTVTATRNTGAAREGTITITQLEGENPETATVTLNQAAQA